MASRRSRFCIYSHHNSALFASSPSALRSEINSKSASAKRYVPCVSIFENLKFQPRLFHVYFLDNIWSSEIDFIVRRHDRLVILSFINSSPYQNDTNTANMNGHETTRFDDSIESMDYDLNPFETHESLQSKSPTENIVAPTVFDSAPIQLSTLSDEYDYYMREIGTTIKETTTLPPTTSTAIITTLRTTLPTTITSERKKLIINLYLLIYG